MSDLPTSNLRNIHTDLILMAAQLVRGEGVPDWSEHKFYRSTPVGEQRDMLKALREADDALRSYGIRLRAIADRISAEVTAPETQAPIARLLNLLRDIYTFLPLARQPGIAARIEAELKGCAPETKAEPRFYSASDHAELLKKIPKVGQDFVTEVTGLSRYELERRVLIQKDWLASYSRCLDGLDLRHIPGSGVESARDPRDIRRIVESLRPAEKTKAKPHCETCQCVEWTEHAVPIGRHISARIPRDIGLRDEHPGECGSSPDVSGESRG